MDIKILDENETESGQKMHQKMSRIVAILDPKMEQDNFEI